MPVLENPIPPLFPNSLQDICLTSVLGHLMSCGKELEERSRRMSQEVQQQSTLVDDDDDEEDLLLLPRNSLLLRHHRRSPYHDRSPATFSNSSNSSNNNNNSDSFYASSDFFSQGVRDCRAFLVAYVSSPLLDSLMDALTTSSSSFSTSGSIGRDSRCAGSLFCLSVLCNERLSHLVATSPMATHELFPSWLGQLQGLSSLTLRGACTDQMLRVVANTCDRLQTLDISHSSGVTDLGLLCLCEGIGPPQRCRFLRELVFNDSSVQPHVVSRLLRRLPMLEVLDVDSLDQGIEHYCCSSFSSTEDSWTPSPLRLIHYTGSDRLSQVMDLCPKLRTFKLYVTEALPSLGATLKDSGNALDHLTLVFGAGPAPSARGSSSLPGLKEFLSACGHRISSLQIEFSDHNGRGGAEGEEERVASSVIHPDDLSVIAENCKFLDSLCFTSFRLLPDDADDVFSLPWSPLNLPFVTEIRLYDIRIDRCSLGKDVFRYLLGGCPDLERLSLSFSDTAYYFSDFLLDDILRLNPLARLECFIAKECSLTLISALRLISSRQKLRTLGQILKWDVEPSELLTFTQILRKANSLKLLQEISIL